MPWRPQAPSPTWRSFLCTHMPNMARSTCSSLGREVKPLKWYERAPEHDRLAVKAIGDVVARARRSGVDEIKQFESGRHAFYRRLSTRGCDAGAG
jgi:hypothetical protein